MIHPESSFALATLRLIRANAMRMAPATPTAASCTHKATTTLLKPNDESSRAC